MADIYHYDDDDSYYYSEEPLNDTYVPEDTYDDPDDTYDNPDDTDDDTDDEEVTHDDQGTYDGQVEYDHTETNDDDTLWYLYRCTARYKYHVPCCEIFKTWQHLRDHLKSTHNTSKWLCDIYVKTNYC